MTGPRWTLLLATAAGVTLCALLAAPFAPAILGATVLAVAFAPFQQRIIGHVRNRSLAAAISTAILTVLVLVPAVLVATAAVRELRHSYAALRARSEPGGGLVASWSHQLDGPLEWMAERTGVPAEDLRAALLERVAQAGGAVLRSTTALAGGITEGVLQTVVALMALFFLLRDGRPIVAAVSGAIPLPREQVDELVEHTGATIVANLYGVMAVALAQGLLAGIGFRLAGLPSPVLWGLVTALASLIPVVGSGLVWVPAVIYLAASGEWGRGLFLAGWSAGLVAMADNFVRPWVVGQRINSHPLLVFFSLLGGVKVFGLAGLFIGPVILSVTSVLVRFASEGMEGRGGTDAAPGPGAASGGRLE